MRGMAHGVIGAAVGCGVVVALAPPSPPTVMLAALCGAVAGLLPDIDHPHSTLGRYVPWPAAAMENHRTGFVAHGRRWFGGRSVWHRGETHSVGAAGIAALVAGGVATWALRGLPLARMGMPGPWALGGLVAAVVVAAYGSHLAADLVNVSPQMLWWPFRRRMVHVPHWHGIREASPAGHLVEAAVSGLAALAAVALLIH